MNCFEIGSLELLCVPDWSQAFGNILDSTQPPSDGIVGMNFHAEKKLHLFICFEIGFHMGFTKRIISLETAFIFL